MGGAIALVETMLQGMSSGCPFLEAKSGWPDLLYCAADPHKSYVEYEQ